MKSCPACKRVYPDDAGFCPADGTGLITASMVPVASTEDVRIGARLCDRYEVRRVVADGGMGRVYEGIDRQTNTRIAIKVLHDDVARDEVAVERFKREYELSKSLPHDYIVNVMDFQRDPALNVQLLVMEFLDGEELRLTIKREKSIAPERVLRMLSQVANGLDEAHAKNFVHRDLKPDNIFLCGSREGDITKILDFGSVKDKNKDAKKLTVLGTTIGSPFYMAPEQAQGLDTLDARADVFALAAITYECITGSVPFEGSNGPSILLAIMTKEPDPPSEKARKKGARFPVPPAMDAVIEEALAKNPNIRTRTVGALADAVGHAYGLTGDHRLWARTPQSELARQLAESMPRAMALAPARALEASADPFAAGPTAGGPRGGQTMQSAGQGGYPQGGQGHAGGQQAQQQQQQEQHGQGMDQAFQAVRAAQYSMDEGAAGVPQGRPPWIIPVVVGVIALFVGGGLALIISLAR